MFQSGEARSYRTEFKQPTYQFPNPFTSIQVLRNNGSLLVITITAINYAVKMTLQTSLGAQCIKIYNLSFLEGGLIYISSGIGSGLGSFLTGTGLPPSLRLSYPRRDCLTKAPGKFVDRTYRKTVDRLYRNGVACREISPDFPLEETRLRGIYFFVATTSLGTLGYGLVLMTRTVCSTKHYRVQI